MDTNSKGGRQPKERGLLGLVPEGQRGCDFFGCQNRNVWEEFVEAIVSDFALSESSGKPSDRASRAWLSMCSASVENC